MSAFREGRGRRRESPRKRSGSRVRHRSRSGTRLPKRIFSPDSNYRSLYDAEPQVCERKLEELKDYIVCQMRFEEPHPYEDYTDKFFISQFRELQDGIERWSTDMTLDYDWDHNSVPGSVWQGPIIPKELVRYVEMVATEDPLFENDWENVIRDHVQRRLLLQAVMWKVLHVHVFSKLLFGASSAQEKMFDSADEVLVNVEGFTRTEIRSKTVRACLGSQIVTDDFYDEADTIAMKLTAMFRPILVLNDIGGFFLSQSTLQKNYHWFHNIVSVAGYLSICIRYSPTIFEWQLLQPNDFWSVHVDEPFSELKNKSHQQFDRSLKAATGGNEGSQSASRWATSVKVKIASSPGVSRHKRGDGTEFNQYNGTRVVKIQSQSAVFYCARQNPKKLAQYVAEKNGGVEVQTGTQGKAAKFGSWAAILKYGRSRTGGTDPPSAGKDSRESVRGGGYDDGDSPLITPAQGLENLTRRRKGLLGGSPGSGLTMAEESIFVSGWSKKLDWNIFAVLLMLVAFALLRGRGFNGQVDLVIKGNANWAQDSVKEVYSYTALPLATTLFSSAVSVWQHMAIPTANVIFQTKTAEEASRATSDMPHPVPPAETTTTIEPEEGTVLSVLLASLTNPFWSMTSSLWGYTEDLEANFAKDGEAKHEEAQPQKPFAKKQAKPTTLGANPPPTEDPQAKLLGTGPHY
ncbi:hypothetical protein MKZ38_007850 [Zalerion maritima]|uniref:Uncharacterized protein n=1 Tax=Zalerion maritima TaxID=339359 RepID=A0AAD5WVT0_9PEZI|nr:hypothetical protein MKZ38_007850 [Zalerion maritima]